MIYIMTQLDGKSIRCRFPVRQQNLQPGPKDQGILINKWLRAKALPVRHTGSCWKAIMLIPVSIECFLPAGQHKQGRGQYICIKNDRAIRALFCKGLAPIFISFSPKKYWDRIFEG